MRPPIPPKSSLVLSTQLSIQNAVYIMDTLVFALISAPTETLYKHMHDFISAQVVDYSPKTAVTYYVLYEGVQYFNLSPDARMHIWKEIEVELSSQAMEDFIELVNTTKQFDNANNKIKHVIREILRKCITLQDVYESLPNCAISYLPTWNNVAIPSGLPEPDSEVSKIIKGRVIELMILFP